MAQASVLTDTDIRSHRPKRGSHPDARNAAVSQHRLRVVRNNPFDFAILNPRKTGRFEIVKARTKNELFLHTQGSER